MFQWLKDEMAQVQTRKFYLVDGPASDELRRAVESSDFPLPPSYQQFVLQLGNAQLYRSGSIYYVTIYAGPREVESAKGEALIQIGRTETSMAYFKDSLLMPEAESPVFEWRHHQGLRRAADGFEPWLKAKCRAARTRYKKREWEAILQGPPPFTIEEQAIVAARRKFRWRVVGSADNGDIQFEVHNGSDMVLPFLSIGIRGKHGQVNGGVWLKVASILPGETRVIEKDCYKKWLPPEDVDAFEKPDPGPEDRDRYWEFRALG